MAYPLKKDSVNRHDGVLKLPMANLPLQAGDHIVLSDAQENRIDPTIRDCELMEEPLYGDAFGDALFDAAAPGSSDVYIDAREFKYVLDELTNLPILDEFTNLPILDEYTQV